MDELYMQQKDVVIKRALISVSDKKNLIEFARGLAELNIEIVSTGGTCQALRDANIAVRDVSDMTHFPEIMDGRVKTLHPNVHGGILGKRDVHADIAKQHDIHWIDLVVVNLYPFAETIKKPNVTWDEAIENIDIGGPTMIRSAAKNMEWASVIVDTEDYVSTLLELQTNKCISFASRKRLATKAFQHTAAYDAVISHYLAADESVTLTLKKHASLRYGENPHQSASAYVFADQANGILHAKQHQGKQLSYNNITDADAAVRCVQEFSEPACVIVKHANPCGAAIRETIDQAFHAAFHADSVSAFGGIVALNRLCTKAVAEMIAPIFFEVLIAPAYEQEALDILAEKVNLRVLQLESSSGLNTQELKFIEGGVIIQDKDAGVIQKSNLKIVTQAQPTDDDFHSMLFAWPVLKHIKSNGILIAKNNATVGIGAGQVSRIDAVDIALRKAGDNIQGAILASDAFFPFRDSIDRIAATGVRAIIQPGGSVRDQEVISACNENNIAMVFTGMRCFKH